MLNVLVIEDDLSQCKYLINCISQSNLNIRLNAIATSGKEALNIISQNKIDIILLDLILPDFTGIKLRNLLSKNSSSNYENSIIIVSAHDNMITEAVANPYVYDYIKKPYYKEALVKKIKPLCEMKESINEIQDLREKILHELKFLNYKISYNGTKYLIDSILELHIRNKEHDNLKKDIYPILSRKYKKSVNNIKCNITQATKMMYLECKDDTLREYFRYYDIHSRPTVKEVIFTVLNKL